MTEYANRIEPAKLGLMKAQKILSFTFTIFLFLISFNSWAANDSATQNYVIDLPDYITNSQLPCQWVDKVGSKTPASTITTLPMNSCLQPGSETFKGNVLCKGIIHCSGLSGLGDIYFDNIVCPGNMAGGSVNCGGSSTDGFDKRGGVYNCIQTDVTGKSQLVNLNGSNVIDTKENSTAPLENGK